MILEFEERVENVLCYVATEAVSVMNEVNVVVEVLVVSD